MLSIGTVARRFVNLGRSTAVRAASPDTSNWGIKRILEKTRAHHETVIKNLSERILTRRISLSSLLDMPYLPNTVLSISVPAINEAYQKCPQTLIVFLRDMIIKELTNSAVTYYPKVEEAGKQSRCEKVMINMWLIDESAHLLRKIKPEIKSAIMADISQELMRFADQELTVAIHHRTGPTIGVSLKLQTEMAKIIRSLQL